MFAYADELDRWLASHTAAADAARGAKEEARESGGRLEPDDRRRRRLPHRLLVMAGLGLVGIVLAAVYAARPARGVARASVVDGGIVAVDSRARELWRYQLPSQYAAARALAVRVTDVDGDSRSDVVVAAGVQRAAGDGTGLVWLLDGSGRLFWQRSLGDRYRFGETMYGPTWYPDDAVVHGERSARRVSVALHHHTWWPDVVATFDSRGEIVSRFVNAGWIYSLNMTSDGRYLLAAGVSNDHGGAVLAVLDARVSGAAPPNGVLPPCVDCPTGRPVAYFVMPWSDVARPSETPHATVLVGADGRVELRAEQRSGFSVPELILTLSPRLEILDRRVSDTFVETHALAHRTGELDHAFDACRWRVPPVREWTPESDWRDVR